jgi:hypothetical protein
MTTIPALAEMVRALDAADIARMVVGSHASTTHGSPRATHDLDLVVEIDERRLDRLLDVIDRSRFYVPEDSAYAAVVEGGRFNVLDLETGWKFDLVVRRDRPFSQSEFERRRRIALDGVPIDIATPEDTVLAKLEWASAGGSDRQLEDVISVLAVSRDQIDDSYLDLWAEELGVVELLADARRRAATRRDR